MAEKRITLLGVNHKTTPLAIREKMALTDGYEGALDGLKRVPGVLESYMLSTCNRVELLCVSESGEEFERGLKSFLFQSAVGPEKWDEYSYLEVAQHDLVIAHLGGLDEHPTLFRCECKARPIVVRGQVVDG